MGIIISCSIVSSVCVLGCCVGVCYYRCRHDDLNQKLEQERRKSQELIAENNSLVAMNNRLSGVIPTGQVTATTVGVPVSPGPAKEAWSADATKPAKDTS